MRVVVPPLGNEFIALIKFTSLASIIGFSDLLRNAQDIYYANAKVIELLMVAAFWYLVVVSILSVGQAMLERRSAAASPRALRDDAPRVGGQGRQAVRHLSGAAKTSRSTSTAGEVVCIIGPSGSGKTTFLRCINQLERIDAGALGWMAS